MSNSKLLVVDDDLDTCELVATALGTWGYEVETAVDGFEAFEKACSMNPDLVVLDIMMPALDGFETCRRIRNQIDAPVLFLSARRDLDSVVRGMEAGGVDYMRKPFRITELRQSIENLLNGEVLQREDEVQSPYAQTWQPDRTTWQRSFYFASKRALDFLIAVAGLVLASPLLLLMAILIKLESPGPVIFKQIRIGARRRMGVHGEEWETKPFTFYKLRSMLADADPSPHREYVQALIKKDVARLQSAQNAGDTTRKLISDGRVTRIGRFLRRSSLDELPQLWNVARGEMSVVGPRPPIPYEVEAYESWHHRRLEAKPGLTGLWQVTARSSVGFDEMARLDIWYAEQQSLWMDLKIMLKTPVAVLSMRGAW